MSEGDSLWRIAESTLSARWGRKPDGDDILAYVAHLVDTNSGVFINPRRPDLIFPGQVFQLPSAPAGD